MRLPQQSSRELIMEPGIGQSKTPTPAQLLHQMRPAPNYWPLGLLRHSPETGSARGEHLVSPRSSCPGASSATPSAHTWAASAGRIRGIAGLGEVGPVALELIRELAILRAQHRLGTQVQRSNVLDIVGMKRSEAGVWYRSPDSPGQTDSDTPACLPSRPVTPATATSSRR